MPDIITLTTPATPPTITTWKIEVLTVEMQDLVYPTIRLGLLANTGERMAIRLAPGTYGFTQQQVQTAVNFINSGGFVAQGKTLNRWMLEQLISRNILQGTAS